MCHFGAQSAAANEGPLRVGGGAKFRESVDYRLMEQLDVKTILVILAVTLDFTAAALLVLLHENRHIPGLGFFLLSCIGISTGSLLLVFQERLPAWLSIAVGDTLVAAAAALALEGIRRFYGGRPRWRWIAVVTALSLAGFTLFTSVWPNLPARVLLVSALLSSLSFCAAWVAVRHRRSEAFGATFFIVAGFALMGLANSVRLVLGLSIESLFSANVYTVLAIGGTLLCFLCWTAGVVMTVAHRNLLEARRATAAKARFLAVMSHEIRTPMNGVIGVTEIVLESDLDAEQRRFIAQIQSSGRDLMKILDDILDFSKLEAGKLRLEYSEMSLDRILTAASEFIVATAASKGLAYERQLDDDLPESIQCDPVRVGQILTNLLSNAVKFTMEGRILLRACRAEGPAGEDRVRFEVSDTGVGIPKETRGFLFRSFSQADASTARDYGGTGLGLAISRQLVDLLGGRIGVDSEEGLGSTFWFEIPLDPPDTASRPSTVNPSSPAKVKARRRRTARILVAEDDAVSQLVISAMLKKLGHSMDLVTTGLEAVEGVGRNLYDLVLMDCQMPDMNGFEATELIRADPSNEELTIIALTAGVLPEQRQRCLDVGMDDVLAKPITAQSLAEMLNRHLCHDTTQDIPPVPASAHPR